MNPSLRIAWRYLFARKSHNAINIVSGVSAAGVCVVTMALVCVLSVMNGFGSLVEQMFSAFDPELKITPATGKTFRTDTEAFRQLRTMDEVAVYSETVEETALIIYNDKQVPALLKGVDDNFEQLTAIDSIIVDGSFSVCDYFDDGSGAPPQRAFERAVFGQGLANNIGIGAHFVSGIKLYAPKRTGRVNMLRPDKSFNQAGVFISGVFAVNQTKYDDSYMLVSLPLARELFEYDETEATAVELSLQKGTNTKQAQKKISTLLGDDFVVRNRYEQQEDFFRIMKIEKAMTALLLVFILMIASFNIIGSLSMLMIDKQEDIRTLSNLGATPKQIQQVFLFEGWLISALGSAIGLVLGLIVCLGQEHFGWLKLGNGTNYIISAYPVKVQALDILIIAAVVLLLGFVAAWYPTRQLKQKI